MNAQVPIEFPFSVIDIGLAALAIVAMGFMAWVFTRLANQQHKVASEAFKEMVDLLEQLTAITRQVASEMQNVQMEIAHAREEIWRNRELINRGLDRAAEALKTGADITAAIADQDRRARIKQRQAAEVEDWRRQQPPEGGDEHVGT